MKTLICLDCGTKWFSSELTEQPCDKCGGKIIEIFLTHKSTLKSMTPKLTLGEREKDKEI